ncbi:MAG: GNAT family N-acetyltransferase [Oscillospiraceae bacterium]|jgi:predicted N-acetyltransferase YhbS|nr:GNAT family N-acetyltransferase [Oscillospiraceae bacterium]
MNIRLERPEDCAAILRLTYEAFLTLDFPGRRRMDEHYLIHLLQGSPFVVPALCFVAEQSGPYRTAGEIVGHILYTASKVIRPDGSVLPTLTFGPLSVLPKYHRQGIGRALVRHGMDKAREMGFGAVLITGVPEYYPKLGFGRGREFGLTLPDGTSGDEFMVYELTPGYLGGGVLQFDAIDTFEQAENDDAGFAAFHGRFMTENFPGQITLRPFWEADIALMERWLFVPHVAKWYQRPDHWLNELHHRRGEFAFLHHFIAEYEGAPIGFCQYYDTHFAQEHEVWNEEWRISERQGEVFSIDYLIGEPDFLHKGFGQKMLRLLLDRIRAAGAKAVIVQPEKENIASNRLLKSSGFEWNGEDYVLKWEE